jgi:Putative Actinobacterial Holin-X, holin superfamily III
MAERVDAQRSISEVLGELSQESAGLIREELRLIAADLTAQGRRVGGSAALLGGAGVLGVGAFGALTAGLIALLGRRPARGALMVAALYGAGAGALAEAALKRLGEVAPEAAQALRRDLKAAAAGTQRADMRKQLGSEARTGPRKPSTKAARPRPAKKRQPRDTAGGR